MFRPFLDVPFLELEAIFDRHQDDHAVLKQLFIELSIRSDPHPEAVSLRNKVESRLHELAEKEPVAEPDFIPPVIRVLDKMEADVVEIVDPSAPPLDPPAPTGPDPETVSEDLSLAPGRLIDLLGYIEHMVRLDERPVLRLAEHRLAHNFTLVLHQHELVGLPGVELDTSDGDGDIWLRISRVRRTAPPAPPDHLAEWIELGTGPNQKPSVRSDIVQILPTEEKDRYIALGEAREEDCALSTEVPDMWDVRLRLSDRPALVSAIDSYINGPWTDWAADEQPRRRSIALYQKLFEIAQLVEMGAGEQPFELVWGLGMARWRKNGRELDLPIVEKIVELELGDEIGSDIRIRPRSLMPMVDLRPYDELGTESVTLALGGAQRTLSRIEADENVSPFLRESFESVLRITQSQLDPEGVYLPDHHVLKPEAPLPPAGDTLVVSDRWVLFARRRSDSFLLRDIDLLKAAVAASDPSELPGPARALVLGPDTTGVARTWMSVGDRLGAFEEVAQPLDDEPDPQNADLFFPKPFNDAQVEIAQRLNGTDGVVVQGPPGTGKTHTIANIICHSLATGRRVLVVSHGEPALAVLRDQLPESIRDLAISVTTSEREGLKQLETAVRLLQSIVERIKPREQRLLIREKEQSVLEMRRRLADIDNELAEQAARHLEPAPGGHNRPVELAEDVARDRDRHVWFEDRPPGRAEESNLSDEDLAALRAARIAVGTDIAHIGEELPLMANLPDGPDIVRWHEDLIRADELRVATNAGDTFARRFVSRLKGQELEAALAALNDLRDAHRIASEDPWLERLMAQAFTPHGRASAILPTLISFAQEASLLMSERARFLNRPIDLPQEPFDESAEALIERLAKGERVFGMFAFKAKKLRPQLQAIRLSGQSAATPADWAHVLDYLRWRRTVQAKLSQWRVLVEETSGPLLTGDDPASLRRFEALLGNVESVLSRGPGAAATISGLLSDESLRTQWNDEIAKSVERLDSLLRVVEAKLSGQRLATVSADVKRTRALFDGPGAFKTEVAAFFDEALGQAQTPSEAIESRWEALRARMRDLHALETSFETILNLARRIEAAGAPRWSAQVRSMPAEEDDDPLVPADWRDAWDWAASYAFLISIDGRERAGKLTNERLDIEARLRRTLEELVRDRIFYTLVGSMTAPVKGALMMVMTALRKIGKGTGESADRHRKAARMAMEKCFDSVPCWIMPTWRVAEMLPATLGSFDLVIIDEASQSDIREIPALLRGRKILVVGDDKQVSPMAAFIENAKIERLERSYLKEQPYRTLLLPGSSVYDLARVMFPDKLVMLREHFRCVEPIIRFSTQFYPEPLVPLRVPTADERIDPPLIDIHVADGRRDGARKINRREATVIVDEIERTINDPRLARSSQSDKPRSIGVISLIGGEQAALIYRLLVERLGEEAMLRHRIACGDSATFQGNERDIVFISMVADEKSHAAQTALQFEQRFNVAMSRARDRLVLVRSVKEEDLNPHDLKAAIVRHFRDPMSGGAAPDSNPFAACNTAFEREVLRRLLDRGYRVRPQVGAEGYRIDLVVEGAGDRRLAVECDGDRYHGPERWADDMRRQRVLERVGWRFWRCWASTFALDPEGCMADLFTTLDRLGIEPLGEGERTVYTEFRTLEFGRRGRQPKEKVSTTRRPPAAPTADRASATEDTVELLPPSAGGIGAGDRVQFRYLDNNKIETIMLSEERHDEANGVIQVTSPLGRGLLGRQQDDEVDVPAGERTRRVLVLKTERIGGMAVAH